MRRSSTCRSLTRAPWRRRSSSFRPYRSPPPPVDARKPNPANPLAASRGDVDCASSGHPLQGVAGAQATDERQMSVTSGTKRKEGGIGETARVVFHALIIALVIRTFLFQPFNIPSGSMKATLLVGDYLFVSKYSYGYSKYSLPLSPPVFSGRLPGGMTPDRGDVVVFRLPKDPSVD